MRYLFIFLGFFLNSSILAATTNTLSGHSIAVQGQVDAGGEAISSLRRLKRGSALYSLDLVTTGIDGRAQLKFLDGGLITLIPNTTYRINSYIFTEKKSEVLIELSEGGFRAMTGTIGKTAPTNYIVKTPIATIGVRGTIFEVLYRGGELNVGSLDGTVFVSNKAGAVVLPPGFYVTTHSPSTIGTPTNSAPAAISAVNFTPPRGGESLEQAQAAINQQPIVPPVTQPTESSSSTTTSTSTSSSSTSSTESTLEPQAGEKEGWLYVPESVGNPSCGK